MYAYVYVMYICTSVYFYLPVEDWGESYTLCEGLDDRGDVRVVYRRLLDPEASPSSCVCVKERERENERERERDESTIFRHRQKHVHKYHISSTLVLVLVVLLLFLLICNDLNTHYTCVFQKVILL